MKTTLTTLFLFYCLVASAQKEANNWVFGGNAGLSWNTGAPVPFSGSAMNQLEGVACISDANGQLLFYTDGISVWNRQNLPMLNGAGLMGNSSSAQSAIVVPFPGHANQYYLFTCDDYYAAGANGYRYSIVDMTLNGGLGAITGVKNVLLYGPSTEKLQAVKNAAGTGYWIVTHAYTGNTFKSYELTSAGLSAPVTSTVGYSYSGSSAIGCMTISPDGTKLATVIAGTAGVEVYDFSTSTGMVSNAISLGPAMASTWIYGVSISPDNSRLYVTEENTSFLVQYDLTAGNQAAINASKVTAGITFSSALQTMQLAPDGKIYVSRNGAAYLGVINNPNGLGTACNYVDDGIYLGGATARYGLPAFVQSFFNFQPAFTAQNLCLGDSTAFSITNNCDSVKWNFGDVASGNANQSPVLQPAHVFSDTGTFSVTMIAWSAGTSDTVTQAVVINAVPPFSLGNDTSICSAGSILLSPGVTGATYHWQDNSTLSTFTVTQTGTYAVTVTASGCSRADTITVAPGSLLPVTITANVQVICASDSAHICAPGGYATYLWNTGSANTCINTSLAGNYYVTVTDNSGCSAQSNHLAISVHPLPPVSISVNGDTLNAYNAVTYQWWLNGVPISGATDSSYVAHQGGNYAVAVTDTNGCGAISNPITIMGIEELGTRNWEIGIYPNPATNELFIQSSEPVGEIYIYNVAGEVVIASSQIPNNNGQIPNNKIQIPIEVLASGVYVVEVISKSSAKGGDLNTIARRRWVKM